jgi:hypothetical protein
MALATQIVQLLCSGASMVTQQVQNEDAGRIHEFRLDKVSPKLRSEVD